MASWALIRAPGTDKGSLLVHVEKEHPEEQRSQSNMGFIFTKKGVEGRCDRKSPDSETLMALGGLGAAWPKPWFSSAASVPFRREQFLQGEQDTGSRCCCGTSLKCLPVGKIPLQESVTKKDIFVLRYTLLERPAPGCQHRDAPAVRKGSPRQLGSPQLRPARPRVSRHSSGVTFSGRFPGGSYCGRWSRRARGRCRGGGAWCPRPGAGRAAPGGAALPPG